MIERLSEIQEKTIWYTKIKVSKFKMFICLILV